jgi:hypothetical protein
VRGGDAVTFGSPTAVPVGAALQSGSAG